MTGSGKPHLLQNTTKVPKHTSRKLTDSLLLEERAALEVCPDSKGITQLLGMPHIDWQVDS